MRRSTRCRRCRCSASMRDAAEVAVVVAGAPPRQRRRRRTRLRQPAQAANRRCARRPSSGERDLVGTPAAPQQRDGVEMLLAGGGAAGAGEVERAAAAAAHEQRARERRLAQRRLAGGAAIAVGEHGAVDVRDDQVDALERERAERPGLDRPGLLERQPARRARRAPRSAAAIASGLRIGFGSATPSTSRPSRSGAASSSASLIASSSVAAEAGQPWQWPTSLRCATPSSSRSSCTSPPCDSMYGRTLASASSTRVLRAAPGRGRGSAAGFRSRRRPRAGGAALPLPAPPARGRCASAPRRTAR